MSVNQLANFKADCRKLINEFLAKNSSKFKDFASVWRDMQFSFVFFGQRPLGLMRQFTEDALIIAKDYWLKADNLCQSIAGLYLMYGLYFKNRLPGLIKIPITLDEMELVSNFAKSTTESTYEDAAFILQKLFDNEAFHFSACVHSYGLERQYRQKPIPNTYEESEKFDTVCNAFKEFMPTYDHYLQSKQEVSDLVSDLSVSNTFSSELPADVRRQAGLSTDDPSTSKTVLSKQKQRPSKNKRKKNSDDDDDLSDFSPDDPRSSRRVFTQRVSRYSRNKRDLSGLTTDAPSTSRGVFTSSSSRNKQKKKSSDTSVLPGSSTDAPSTSKTSVSQPKQRSSENKRKRSSLDAGGLTGLSSDAPSTSQNVLPQPETRFPDNKIRNKSTDKDTDVLPDIDEKKSYIITSNKSGIHSVDDNDTVNSDDIQVQQILNEMSHLLKPLISPLSPESIEEPSTPLTFEEQPTLEFMEEPFTSGLSSDAPSTSQNVLPQPETSFPVNEIRKKSTDKDTDVLPDIDEKKSYIITSNKSGIHSVGDNDTVNSDDIQVQQILNEMSHLLKPLISPLSPESIEEPSTPLTFEEQPTLEFMEEPFTSGLSSDAPSTSQNVLPQPETSFPDNKIRNKSTVKDTNVLPDIDEKKSYIITSNKSGIHSVGDNDTVNSDDIQVQQILNEMSHLLKPLISPLRPESIEEPSTPLTFEDLSTLEFMEEPFTSGLSSNAPSTSQSVLPQPETSFPESKSKNSTDKDTDVTNNKSGIHSEGDYDVIGLKGKKTTSDLQNQSAKPKHDTVNSDDVQEYQIINDEVSDLLQSLEFSLSPQSYEEQSTPLAFDEPSTSQFLEEPFPLVFSGEVANSGAGAGEDNEFSWIFQHDNE